MIAQEIVGHRPRRRHAVEGEGDRGRFGRTDEDRHRPAGAVLAGLGASRLADRFTGVKRRGGAAVAVAVGVLALATGTAAADRWLGPFVDVPFPVTNALLFGLPALMLILAFATGHLGRKTFVAAAILLALVDLSLFVRARYPNVYGHPQRFLETPDTVAMLREDPEIFRAGHFTNGFAVQKRIKIDESVVRATIAGIYPNFSLHHGTHDPQGVYSLKIERYTDFVRRLNAGVKGGRWILDRLTMLGNPFSPLFDLLNVKYILTAERNPFPMTRRLPDSDGASVLPGAPEASDLLLDLRFPPGGALPSPVRVSVTDTSGNVSETEVAPAWFDKEMSAFYAFEAPPPTVETEVVTSVSASTEPRDAGWEIVGPGAKVEAVDGRLRLDGDDTAQILSPPIDFEHRLEIRFTATPSKDNAGVYVSLIDAETDTSLYTFIYADEGFTGLLRRQRGVQATRAIRTRAGRADTCTAFFEQDRLGFSFGERSLLRYRDPGAPQPARIRVEVGVRGGAIDFDSIEIRRPVAEQRWRSARAIVPLAAGSIAATVAVSDGEIQRVTLLDRGKFTRVLESDGIRVYRNERVLPRAFLVGGYRVFDDDDALLDALASKSFDPTAEVLLRAEPGLTRPPGAYELGDTTAEIESYGPNRVEIRAACDEEAILYLGDVMFPGWEVRVDGEPAEILEANHCFRAVALPPGEHRVEFVYRPTSFRNGAIATGATALIWLALAALTLRRSRRPRTAPEPTTPEA